MPRVEEVIPLYPKQEELYNAVGKYRYIYYGGARGGGKTYGCCAVAVRMALRYPGINIVIIRQTVEEIKQYIVPTITGVIFPQQKYSKYYRYKERDKLFQFSNSSLIFLRPLDNEADVRKEQGIERNLYIIDEANNIPIDYLIPLDGSLRNSRIVGYKPSMIMTGNPGGISDNYFWTHFVHVDYSKWTPEELEQKDEYFFVSAKLEDNPSLDRDGVYRRALMKLPENLRKAWLEGRWDVFSGQFFEEWNEEIHTVKDFPIPKDWPRWRSVDLGRGSHPSVCLWFAMDPDNKLFYCYREFIHYGSATDFARGIVQMSYNDWGEPEDYQMTYADPNIFARNNMDYDMEQYFRAEGVILEPSSNDRKLGWKVVKEWLHWEKLEDGKILLPRIRFFRGACPETIYALPRVRYAQGKGEDCDSRGVDDHADALRYFCIRVMGIEPEYRNEVSQQVHIYDDTMWKTTSAEEVSKVKFHYFSDEDNLKFKDEESDILVSPYSWY
jgi:phage terminase large subunit